MSQYSELKQVLQGQLNWHGARISFLALFLLALLESQSGELERPVFRVWWESITPIKLQAVAAVFSRV